MSDEPVVVRMRLPVSENMTARQALLAAQQMDLTDVLIAAYNEAGELVVVSSHMTVAEASFLAQKMNLYAMSGGQQGPI